MLDDFVAPRANVHKEVIGEPDRPPNERVNVLCKENMRE